MKYTTLALVLGLGAFSPAFSADWTGLLQGMQNDCETQTIVQKLHKKTSIPKALRGDIVKYTAKEGNYSLTSHVDIRLKNATAFGKPITRIYNDESGGHSLNVYFTDGNFANIKSKFTVTVNGQKHAVGKNKAWLLPYDPYAENAEPEPPEAVSIPYKGVDYKKYQHLDDDNSPHIIVTHGNGWWSDSMSGERMGEYTGLKFDSKKKMVSCSSSFG